MSARGIFGAIVAGARLTPLAIKGQPCAHKGEGEGRGVLRAKFIILTARLNLRCVFKAPTVRGMRFPRKCFFERSLICVVRRSFIDEGAPLSS